MYIIKDCKQTKSSVLYSKYWIIIHGMIHCDASLWPQVIVKEVHNFACYSGLYISSYSKEQAFSLCLSFIWLLETALQFPSETLLDEAQILFMKGRCSRSMIWAFLPYIVSHTAVVSVCFYRDLSRSNSRTHEYQRCHQQTADAIMTLTVMMNGAVYIFPMIQASQGHFAFWFLLLHLWYMFSLICSNSD